MLTPRYSIIVLLTIALFSATEANAENWPGWRGPRGDGTSSETNVPTKWSGTENIAWKVPLVGYGHSSPVIWGDRVLLTTCLKDDGRRQLICLDRKTGKTLWKQTVLKAPLEKKHGLNSFASGTPATDGKLIYVTFLEPDGPGSDRISPGNMVVAAYDFHGKRQWIQRPGRFASRHGYCSSPVIFEEKLIVNGDHDGNSYLIGLNKTTGKTAWRTMREHKTRSYCTPIIRKIDGRTQMILSGSKCIASYDPNDGSRHWKIDGPTEQYVATMVYNGDLLLMTAGFPDHHILAIRPDGKGNVTDTHIAWRTTKGCSYVPSPIAAGKYFLVVSDRGLASCFEATNGTRHWMERMGRHYSGSLVSAGGLVYFTADDGMTTIVRPGKKYDVVAINQLGERCYASPAISGGQIFIRGEKHLFCVGK